ncbi:hypothetical protein Q1695_008490 [Nippostrongylus brasiliensis]|nr:hypothetical protein Q1695_008490 [Nippostrongylus brasiliensis]
MFSFCENFETPTVRREDVVYLEGVVAPAPTTSQPKSYCTGEQAAQCVPPLVPFRQRYLVADKYRLVGCAPEKNFSTMLTAIFCYLFDEERFLEHNRTFSSEAYHRRFCAGRNEYDTLTKIEQNFKVNLTDWKMLAVVRDPLERFVSGFADKCLIEQTWKKFPYRCHRCKTNLKCFMERQYARMMKKASTPSLPANFDDDHFFPQNWRCEFNTRLRDFEIIRFDTERTAGFLTELVAAFNESKVPSDELSFIKASVDEKRTPHSTKDSKEHTLTRQQILSNEQLLNLLIKMYFYDFVLFGFPFPGFGKTIE